jgi:O-antigen ligase
MLDLCRVYIKRRKKLKKVFKVVFSGEFFFVLFVTGGYYKEALGMPFDFTLLFLVLSILVSLKRIFVNPNVNRLAIAPLTLYCGMIALFLISMFWSDSEVYALDKTLRFIVITGWAFVGGLLLIYNKESAKRFIASILVVSTLGSLFMGFLFVVNSSQTGFISIAGGNYLGAARLCGLGAMILLVYFFFGERKLLSLTLLSIHTLALLSTGARMPLVAFSAIFMLLTFRGVRYAKGNLYYTKHTKYIIVSLLFVIVMGFFLVKTDTFSTTINRFEILFTEENGGNSANGRLMRFSEALEMFGRSPILGEGVGSFPVSFSSVDARDYPHNIFLELLSELGLVGLVMFLCLFLLPIYRFFKINNNNRLLLALMAGLLFSFLNSLVSGDVNDNRILFTFISIITIAPTLFKFCKKDSQTQ